MKFMSNEEGRCPICNSQMIEYFGMELEDTAVYYPWHCPDCDTDGKEWYYVNFSEVRSNDDTIGDTQGVCPDCGAEIEYGTAEPEGNSLGYEYFCPECENSGTEWYDLDFDSHTINGHEDEEIDVVKESKSVNDIETELNSKVAQYKKLKKVNKDDTSKSKDLEDEIEDLEAQLKKLKKEDINYKDDKIRAKHKKEETKDIWYSVELYGPSGNDRYDVTDTYKEAIASKKKGEKEYPNCRFEIVKMNGSIPTQKVNKKEISEGLEINKPQNKPVQAVEVTFKDKSMLFKTNQVNSVFVDARKFMIPLANELNLEVEDIKNINVNVIYEDGEKSSVRIKPFDYQDTAYERYKALGGTEVFGQFQDWYSFNGYDEYGNKVRRKKHSKLNGYANDGSQKRLSVESRKQEISEGLDVINLQNKPIKAIEVTLNDKSMLFRAPANVRDVFVDARLYMKPFANKLNLEVEDVKNININIVYEDGEKSSVRIKPFDYQDTAYERYKALGGTEVFGQFQDWYSFNGYDEYGNKVRRRKNSKLNDYANDGSQKRLPVENKKQEAVDDEEETDIDFDDTISLLDIALSEIPTVGVEDWGKDDELLFTADTKVMFENLKNYEEEIPKYYYDNASNDDWSNGIDSYLEEIKGVNLNNGDSDNTYNWNAPLTHDVEFTIYEADDGCYFKGSIHRAGDVRGNYTTEFLLKFVDKDDCLETLFDTCSENCYRSVTVDDVEYVVSPHFFNEYVDIWNTKTQESYDDVYCDCIETLREIIAENKNSEE